MLPRHLSLHYEPESDEYAQQERACWLFTGLVQLLSARLPIYYVALFEKTASIIWLLFIYTTIRSLINIFFFF